MICAIMLAVSLGTLVGCSITKENTEDNSGSLGTEDIQDENSQIDQPSPESDLDNSEHDSNEGESVNLDDPASNQQESSMQKAESASEPEPGGEPETEKTQMAPAEEVRYMDIVHIFKPYEQAVEISLQIPEDWIYTVWDVEEESADWGYSVKVHGRDDANFNIFGQFGTLTADGYSNGPKAFQTTQGLTGQYFWDEYLLDDDNPAIQGMIVFDTELAGFYGVSINMPKNIYSESKDIIDKVFQSIVIKEAQ